MERRLRRAGHAPSSVSPVLQRCRELGYLNDRDFALAHVRDRLRLKPKGRRALRSELYRKGVDRALAEEAIDAGFAEFGIDEADVARRLARKRAKALRRLDAAVARRRLAGYLARRGFPPPVVREAVEATLPERDAPSGSPGSARD